MDRRSFFRLAGFGASAAAAVFQPLSAAQQAGDSRAALPEALRRRMQDSAWPLLRHYDAEHIARVAMPLGGVGTGSVSLMGNGALRDWEVANRPAKGFTPVVSGGMPFFALWVRDGEATHTRVLEGPLAVEAFEGSHGSEEATHSLPRFANATFAAAWPLATVMLTDAALPVEVELRAFSPFVPTDADASGWPMAVLEYRVRNRASRAVQASVCGTLPNFVGMDGWETTRDWKGDRHPTGAKRNRNRLQNAPGVRGILLDSEGVEATAEAWGSLALAALGDGAVSTRTNWTNPQWGGALLDFWDDFSEDGALSPRAAGNEDAPVASVAQAMEIPAGGMRAFRFVVAWHFPNRYAWNTPEDKRQEIDRIGNHYTTRFANAWDVAARAAGEVDTLRERTVRFVNAFVNSSLPDVVKEAALFNASTLVTQTCFRTPDGKFYGWEGTADNKGCCHGSCTHVWNYEQTTAYLFGELSWGMREVEFAHATDADGLMSFRVHLPLSRATQYGKPAADGQMGCVMKAYRDWQLRGDLDGLRRLWPHIRRSLEFCWLPGGWDADKDGVMEGAQHNTMDVEYYGPNPQMGFWYLGALRAAAEMAGAVGDGAFGATCTELYGKGSAWMDANLFNGEFYEHRVEPPGDAARVNPKLLVGMGARDLANPDFQLASGCLVDQLVGQYMAHICGLGYLAKQEHVRATLRAILKHNYRESLAEHFNSMRSFALGNEKALLMASYPKERPAKPFPYWSEVMTGFEYTAAIGMLQEGMRDEGVTCIGNIRARYDGWKRSPFDEAECGHHYARAMAAWGAVLAMTGFQYSAPSQALALRVADGEHFFSTGYAYDTVLVRSSGGGQQATVRVLEGRLPLRVVRLNGREMALPGARILGAGETVAIG